ncbi:MAG: Lrp/AsnC family transcriptional regulator [archaeon]
MHRGASERILDLLERDASLTNREIGEKLSLPTTTVHNIIRRLEKDGTIRKYSILIDKEKLGYPIQAVILINTTFAGSKLPAHAEIAAKIKKIGKVDCIHSITGEFDLLVRVAVRSTRELGEFVTKVRKIDGVVKTVTSVVLEELSI